MIYQNPRITFDLDGILTITVMLRDKPVTQPGLPVIEKLRRGHRNVFGISILPFRNTKKLTGKLGKISKESRPAVLDWLAKYNVPLDETYNAKPWCSDTGFDVDERAVRPNQFFSMSHSGINILSESD